MRASSSVVVGARLGDGARLSSLDEVELGPLLRVGRLPSAASRCRIGVLPSRNCVPW